MGLFDPPPSQTAYPRAWRDQSFECKGMFAYHLVMMAMFVTGLVPVFYELAIAGGIVAVLAVVSLDRRRQLGWQRPPIGARDVLKAVGVAAMSALFLFVATHNFPVANDPHLVPWALAGAGIALFGILQQLKLVTFSEAEFVEIGQPKPAPVVEVVNPPNDEPSWHRAVRGVYRVAFFAIWLTVMAFFYFDTGAIGNGSPTPTATATAPIPDHGRTVYVTSDRAHLIELLRIASSIGVPLVVFSGFALQIFARVRLFPGGINFMGRRLDDAG